MHQSFREGFEKTARRVSFSKLYNKTLEGFTPAAKEEARLQSHAARYQAREGDYLTRQQSVQKQLTAHKDAATSKAKGQQMHQEQMARHQAKTQQAPQIHAAQETPVAPPPAAATPTQSTVDKAQPGGGVGAHLKRNWGAYTAGGLGATGAGIGAYAALRKKPQPQQRSA